MGFRSLSDGGEYIGAQRARFGRSSPLPPMIKEEDFSMLDVAGSGRLILGWAYRDRSCKEVRSLVAWSARVTWSPVEKDFDIRGLAEH